MGNLRQTQHDHPVAVATAGIALASICFGLVPLFARVLLADGVSAEAIGLYRYLPSALIMLPFVPRRREKMRQAALLGGAGIAMGIAWLGYLHAIEHAPVASAGVIYMSYPLFALILAKLWLGQSMTRRGIVAAVLVLGAAIVALSPGAVPADAFLPLLLSLPAPIFFAAIIVVLAGLVPALSVTERMACGMLGAVIGLAPMTLAGDLAEVLPTSGTGWLAALAMAALTATLPQLLYSYAAPLAGAGRAAITGAVELPTMFVVGWLAFGEALQSAQLIAGALILLAIAMAPGLGRANSGDDARNQPPARPPPGARRAVPRLGRAD